MVVSWGSIGFPDELLSFLTVSWSTWIKDLRYDQQWGLSGCSWRLLQSKSPLSESVSDVRNILYYKTYKDSEGDTWLIRRVMTFKWTTSHLAKTMISPEGSCSVSPDGKLLKSLTTGKASEQTAPSVLYHWTDSPTLCFRTRLQLTSNVCVIWMWVTSHLHPLILPS